MKKITAFLTVIVCVFTMLISCTTDHEADEEKSYYEMLSDDDRAIVECVMKNKSRFSDCNGIRFSEYNGELYLVANKTTMGTNSLGDGVGRTEKTLFFCVDANSFDQTEEYDPYLSTTAYGFVTDWDSSWSVEEQREALAMALS